MDETQNKKKKPYYNNNRSKQRKPREDNAQDAAPKPTQPKNKKPYSKPRQNKPETAAGRGEKSAMDAKPRANQQNRKPKNNAPRRDNKKAEQNDNASVLPASFNKKPRYNSKPSGGGAGGRGKGGANQRRGGGRPPREHDDYDDIKSYGGKYVETIDYDEFDGTPVTRNAVNNAKPQRKAPIAEAVQADAESAEPGEGCVAGRNAVRELLRTGRSVDKIFVKSGSREGSVVVIVAEAVSRHIPVIEATQDKLDFLSGGTNHQGVVAMAAGKQYCDVEDILKIAEERGEKPLVVIADGIEDPHNLGALIRCAECAGAHGIVIPKRRSAGLTPVVSKASAGAIEHLAVAKVANISQTVELLKKKGLWIFAGEAGGTAYYKTDFDVPAAIIFGSEGEGVGKAIKEKCDFIVSIPMYGKVNSLNVSTAASVILCHAARMQRGDK